MIALQKHRGKCQLLLLSHANCFCSLCRPYCFNCLWLKDEYARRKQSCRTNILVNELHFRNVKTRNITKAAIYSRLLRQHQRRLCLIADARLTQRTELTYLTHKILSSEIIHTNLTAQFLSVSAQTSWYSGIFRKNLPTPRASPWRRWARARIYGAFDNRKFSIGKTYA